MIIIDLSDFDTLVKFKLVFSTRKNIQDKLLEYTENRLLLFSEKSFQLMNSRIINHGHSHFYHIDMVSINPLSPINKLNLRILSYFNMLTDLYKSLVDHYKKINYQLDYFIKHCFHIHARKFRKEFIELVIEKKLYRLPIQIVIYGSNQYIHNYLSKLTPDNIKKIGEIINYYPEKSLIKSHLDEFLSLSKRQDNN